MTIEEFPAGYGSDWSSDEETDVEGLTPEEAAAREKRIRLLAEMLTHLRQVSELLLNPLKDALPKLPVPSSEEDCLKAANDFVKDHRRIITGSGLKKARKELVQRFQRDWTDRPWDWIDWYNECIGKRDDDLLQVFLQKMLHCQDDAVKISVLAQSNPSLDHLSNTCKRPVVSLHNRPATLSGSPSAVPVEIAAMIYSHCDLESAVKLRQVSPFWYNSYQAANAALKSSLNARCPWFRPGGALKTWADCALVFVSRLNNKKWKPVKSIDRVYAPKMKVPPHRIAVAQRITENSKMPANFEPLDNMPSDSPKNLKTLEDTNERYYVRSDTKTERVVEYKDCRLTLPPGTTFYLHGYAVRSLKQHIHVTSNNSPDFYFPRDKPLHHENALRLRFCNEVGHFFTKSKIADRKDNGETRCDHFLLNPYTKEFIQHGTMSKSRPVAAHHGLIWWYMPARNVFLGDVPNTIPTFVDLQTPDKIYYRRDRVVPEHAEVNSVRFNQCQNSRFMTKLASRRGERGMLILDLETSIVTMIERPYKWLDHNMKLETTGTIYDERPIVLPGYVGDKFQAMYVDHTTMKSYEDRKRELDRKPWDNGVPQEKQERLRAG